MTVLSVLKASENPHNFLYYSKDSVMSLLLLVDGMGTSNTI